MKRVAFGLLVVFAWFYLALAGPWAAATQKPIRLHPKNPHYFFFRGKIAAFVSSGEHYGAVMNADFDYSRYLDTIRAAGLNYTRLFGGSYVEVPGQSFGILRNDLAPAPGRFIAPWARSGVPGYAGGGNKIDLDQWNPEYFKRYHDFLQQASDRGIAVEISLFSSHYGDAQWAISPFNSVNNVNNTDAIDRKNLETLNCGNILAYQEKYARKLVREANQFDNVIFEIQNEPWADRTAATDVIGPVNPFLQGAARDRFPNAAQLADEDSVAWQAKVAAWITSEEAALPNKHLIAQGYANFRYPVRSLVPGVSVVNFHYAYPEAVTWNYGLDKAIAYDETGFMGRDDDLYRRQAWNFMLSGGSIFDALDYSFSPGHEDGSDSEPNGPGGGSAALREQLRVLSEFLQSLDLADIRPDATFVARASGTIARALSVPGRQYAVYFDGAGPTDATLLLPPGEYSGGWVDVLTGKAAKAEHLRHHGGTVALHSPDFSNGIALKLDRKGND
jgi:hypothetical protein